MSEETVVVEAEPVVRAKRKYTKRSLFWKMPNVRERKSDIQRERVDAIRKKIKATIAAKVPDKPRAKVYYRRGPWEILQGKKWKPFFTVDTVEEKVKKNLALMFPASKIARFRGVNGSR